MDAGTLAAALGRVAGRFEEGYGSDPDLRDPVDIRLIADLLHEELQEIVEREVRDRLRAAQTVDGEELAAIQERIREWGEAP